MGATIAAEESDIHVARRRTGGVPGGRRCGGGIEDEGEIDRRIDDRVERMHVRPHPGEQELRVSIDGPR